MKVLADTSVWIEFFNAQGALIADGMALLIADDQLVLCQPVLAEILSGKIVPSKRVLVERVLRALPFVDCDWNDPGIWQEMIQMAELAHRHKIKIPGLIDRMLILAAKGSQSKLWTLDKALRQLASLSGVECL